MSAETRNPADPIENLAIGKIIEVDGSRIIAELDPGLTELSRVYAGETYPIGQFGSIVRIHFGRRLIYALVGRLRMKAKYEAEHGIPSHASADERVVEADLFGEGEWSRDAAGQANLAFERGVATYPLPEVSPHIRAYVAVSRAWALSNAMKAALSASRYLRAQPSRYSLP